MKKIDSFRGEYEFLSNFSYSPFIYKDIFYPTVEHYFQANKATTLAKHKEIARATTPSQAKWLGRGTQLRSDWREVRDEVMEVGLRQKFRQNLNFYKNFLILGMPILKKEILGMTDIGVYAVALGKISQDIYL